MSQSFNPCPPEQNLCNSRLSGYGAGELRHQWSASLGWNHIALDREVGREEPFPSCLYTPVSVSWIWDRRWGNKAWVWLKFHRYMFYCDVVDFIELVVLYFLCAFGKIFWNFHCSSWFSPDKLFGHFFRVPHSFALEVLPLGWLFLIYSQVKLFCLIHMFSQVLIPESFHPFWSHWGHK